MPVRRGYRQACGVARGLDLVGERWALLIVRELILGPKRFTELRAGLPGASPNAVADRLRELVGAGVLRHRRLPPPVGSRVYELTDWGRELEPIVLALGTWALGSPPGEEDTFVSLDSLMLTIRTYYSGAAAAAGAKAPGAGAAPAVLRVRLTDGDGESGFGVWFDAGSIAVRHERPDRPDATITTDTATLLALLTDPSRLDAAGPAGPVGLTVDGDRHAVERLVHAIVVPGGKSPCEPGPSPTVETVERPGRGLRPVS